MTAGLIHASQLEEALEKMASQEIDVDGMMADLGFHDCIIDYIFETNMEREAIAFVAGLASCAYLLRNRVVVTN